MTKEKLDFIVEALGEAQIKSPLKLSIQKGDKIANFVSDDELVFYDINADINKKSKEYSRKVLLEKAGPREKIYFNPSHVHAGIVTCGGLCPGLNNVIRAIVRCLWYRYEVQRITGIRYGYEGFLPDCTNDSILELNPDIVDDIHNKGGTILGSSRRGKGRTIEIVDAIERLNLNMLFTIGGDGTQSGALEIAREIEKRNLKINIVGIPKTIDNDLSFIQRSFGFETAVSVAVDVVTAAHIEATDAVNGIGLVKVMGRESGFIAAATALASNDVNFCLIPEVAFDLEGDKGFLMSLEERLKQKQHAVVVIAEGAGQDYLEATNATDASGNKKLNDIGTFLKSKIKEHFKDKMEVNLKYIDPSYIIRSARANPNDSIYCMRLGNNAVHAAMAGKHKVLMSYLHDIFVHVPIELAVSERNYLDPESDLWRDVLEATRQPIIMKN